jgi:hypothetical protein
MGDPRKDIPSVKTTPDLWKNWYNELRDTGMTKVNADEAWFAYWRDRGNNNDDRDLRLFIKDKTGQEIDTNIFGKIRDVQGGIFDFFGSAFTIAKWTGLIIGGVVVLSFAMILINVARKPIEAAKAAADFTPAGQAGKTAGKLKK